MNKLKLKDVLTKKRINHVKSVEDWESAVQLASAPLLNDGSIEQEYVDNMIQSVHDNGSYMVLTDFFALMHASPGKGVTDFAISLLILDDEIEMVGKPVKIFLILAAKDNESHINALSQVTSLLMDEDKFNVFLSGDIEKISCMINYSEEGEEK